MNLRDIYGMGDVNVVDLEEPSMQGIPFYEQYLENIEEFQLLKMVLMNKNKMNHILLKIMIVLLEMMKEC